MGTQQLLLIILVVVVLAVAVGIALTMFLDQAHSHARDSLRNDLVSFASLAQQHYRRPISLRGGEGSFGGLMLRELTSKPTNSNGTYTLVPDPVPAGQQSCMIVGVGKCDGIDTSQCPKATVTVWADSFVVVTDR